MSVFCVGMDIGGTFTDFALLDEGSGRLSLHKRLTTPSDPSTGAIAGLLELLAREERDLRECRAIVHATTLVTNAVIERRGARTGLLVTRGFRDVLELAREQRYDIHDLFARFPAPLVPRPLRLEVDERMSRDGDPLRPLDFEQLLAQAARLVGEGVEAVAVCFLHAYAGSTHERAATAALREAFPGLHVCGSAEVAPQIGEYERMCTTACNAYVLPVVDRYLAGLERELDGHGFAGRLHLMHSGGGLITATTARRLPIRLLESGPAAGAILAARVGASVGAPDLVAFDMGGTTAKTCVVAGGRLTRASGLEVGRLSRFKRGSGFPIRTQVVELMEIGAGGGSIAHADSLGLLAVGPRSAGADPGPACYGFGGLQATVTDACVALGYIDPENFVGGSMRLDRVASERALARLGKALAMSTGVAAAIHRVASERMAGAARAHLIERGLDPRSLPLMAFGGAGPVHAAAVARLLGVRDVIVPPLCGVASAVGLLAARVSLDYARSAPGSLATLDWSAVTRRFVEMEDHATAAVVAADVAESSVRFERSVELRVTGQSHDVEVPVPLGELTDRAEQAVEAAFVAEYERRYATHPPTAPRLAVTWKLRAFGPEPSFDVRTARTSSGRGRTSRGAWFEGAGDIEATVVQRQDLAVGDAIDGPALIEEPESTTVVGPADRCRVDERENLRIDVSHR